LRHPRGDGRRCGPCLPNLPALRHAIPYARRTVKLRQPKQEVQEAQEGDAPSESSGDYSARSLCTTAIKKLCKLVASIRMTQLIHRLHLNRRYRRACTET